MAGSSMPATAIRRSWLRVSRWCPVTKATPQSNAAAVTSMTHSIVTTGRPETAYLYAVFHRAKTAEATISGTMPPRCLMMSRMPAVPPLPLLAPP